MDAFFDAMRIPITKPCTASWPARVTRAGFCFGRKDSKDIMPGGTELSFWAILFLSNFFNQVDSVIAHLRRAIPSLLQRVSWLHF